MMECMSLEDRNYYNDIRITCVEDMWWDRIDERRMMARLSDDGEGGSRIWVPIKFAVCHVCRGKGSVVNPSIDCNGITADEYDDDFRDDYFGGAYDIACPFCFGTRVEPDRIEGRISVEPREEEDY